MSNFVVQFPLKTEKYQEDILEKRFKIGRYIYNSLVTITQNRYKEMIKTKRYRNLIDQLTGDKTKDKPIWKEIGLMRKEYDLTEYSFHKDAKPLQNHFSKNIDAFTAQKIATTLWKAYDKLFYGNGEAVHYKRYDEMTSLEGKSNKTGIRFKDDTLVWKGLIIPVDIDYDNPYEYQALQSEIAYCRIVRKYIRNRYKYYLQIVFKGIPPKKIDKSTGEIKHSIGKGDVGIDIGTSTIAYASSNEVKILELDDKVQDIENQKRILLRKLDRSRRNMNPDNFNDDGTIKKQGNKKVKWNYSNHYKKNKKQLKELYRKQADIRKYQHECLANHIVSLGDTIYVEKMSFSGLAKRAKKTEINDKGKYKRKKRYGKTIANRAPAMLLEIINRKLSYEDKTLIEIDTWAAKASQFNHADKTYTKKKLSQRWNYINGNKIQRDMYSAFLIMNINDDLQSFNIEKCNDRFDNFLELHNNEVQKLLKHKNLKSIGI